MEQFQQQYGIAPRRVLVVAYYFPPLGLSGVQRTAKFVKYLPDYGWEPVVLTTGDASFYAHDDTLLAEIEERGVEIVRVGGRDVNSMLKGMGTVNMPAEWLRKLLSRASASLLVPDNKKGWKSAALPVAKQLLESKKFDAIFASGPPFSALHWASQLASQYGIPFVADYRDLWFGNQFAFYPTPFHSMAIRRMEQEMLRGASKVIVTNRNIKERLLTWYDAFLSYDDVRILSHGFDPADMEGLSSPPQDGTLRLTYTGAFYEYITPKYFLKAVRTFLNANPQAKVELHFAGLLRKENKRLIRKLGLEDVVVDHGYLPHKESIQLLFKSDVLWMMVGKGRNVDTVSSSKLYEYFGTRKPVIACVPEGALKAAAIQYGAGFVADPVNVDDIAEVLSSVWQLYIRKSFPKPKESFIQDHRRDVLASHLAKEFNFLIRDEL